MIDIWTLPCCMKQDDIIDIRILFEVIISKKHMKNKTEGTYHKMCDKSQQAEEES